VTWRCLLLLASLAVSPLIQANTVQVSQEVVGSCEFGAMPTIVFPPTTVPQVQRIVSSWELRCTAGLAVTAQVNGTHGTGSGDHVLRAPNVPATSWIGVRVFRTTTDTSATYSLVNPYSITGTGDWQSIPIVFESRTTAARPVGVYSTVLTITLIF